MYRIVIFFCAILLVVIELLFFELNYIFIVVLCLICLRILCTKSICIVNICLIWCLGCITYIFNYYQCSKSREIKQELSVKNQHILVYADNIKSQNRCFIDNLFWLFLFFVVFLFVSGS